ncbi:MAG: S9 family peptidase [Bacillota bacterium]
MITTSRLLAAIAVLLASCVSQPPATTAQTETSSAPPKRYNVRDFFSNPDKGYFRLSDDGQTLGYMTPTGEARRRNVFVQKLDGSVPVGEAKQLTQETARDISNYFFKGNDRILYAKDFGGDENFHVVSVDIATGKITDLTPGAKVRADIVDDLPEDPNHILVSHNRRNPELFDVYRIDLRTGKEELVAENPGDIVSWTTDHDGRVRIGVRSDGLDNVIVYRPDEKSPFKEIVRTDYKTQVDPQFFDAQNQRFYVSSNRGRDKQALALIDPAHPDAEQVVFVHPVVDMGGADWSRARKRLTRVDYEEDKPEHKFFDPYMERVYRSVEAKLPGMEIGIQSMNKAEDKYVIASYSDVTEGARYIYDVKRDSLTMLAVINPKIDPRDMAPMKPIQYKARDGLLIHGYLTLPKGRAPHDLACVVNPHGGPWARDSWGFNPEVQFLANSGYCVLQMNFRSSTGYGRQFWEAGFGEWGLKMQDDITDGTKWLVSQGIADPKRIAIYGGSYGGYATLAGITMTPDLYAAAVDYVGVSNLLTFMNTIPPYWKPFLPKFYAMVGDPQKDLARLKDTSPVSHVDRIRTPLFIAQGARDPRVNKAESDQMVEALKKRGVDVQYMVKDNEGHGFHNEENRFQFYEAMEKFLASHLHPGQ